MKFQLVGDKEKPFMIMLTGSFCQSACLKYIYEKLEKDFYILLPEYNGHYANSTFTTRKNEAAEVAAYLQEHDITKVRMLYGQSMGAEVGIELLCQLKEKQITVDHCFFDGAPCTRLSGLFKKVMYLKFKSMLGMIKKKGTDGVLNLLLKKSSQVDTEGLRPILEAMEKAAAILTKQSIKNETECCYTFDFPAFDEETQKRMHFFYSKEEKAYRLCADGVKKAYPLADYTVVEGYGHLTYSMKNTDDYVQRLKTICKE